MITWKISQDAFVEFLNNLEKAKAGLHCSISNAWFRGESKFGRDLYLALFRPNLKDDLDQDREGIINPLVGY